jgi:hypothetical protein
MTHQEAFNLYKMIHFLEIASEYSRSLKNSSMNLRVKNVVDSIPLKQKQLKNELKKAIKCDISELFPDIVNDKPFLFMDLYDKCIMLSEEQMQNLVDSVEIVEEDGDIIIEEVLGSN